MDAGHGSTPSARCAYLPCNAARVAGDRRLNRPHAAGFKAARLQAGQKVLVWYDPEDPGDILVYGRWGRAGDWIFIATGALLVLTGLILAAA